MSLGLYMDVHVPAAITRGLILRGVDVITAQLDGAKGAALPPLPPLRTGRETFASSGSSRYEALREQSRTTRPDTWP